MSRAAAPPWQEVGVTDGSHGKTDALVPDTANSMRPKDHATPGAAGAAPSESTEGLAADATALLLEFVRGRDVPCPACGYNLRDLTAARCPECRREIALQVGRHRVPIGILLVAITPSVFSGICALLLFVPLFWVQAPAPIGVFLLDGFGFLSGLAGLTLFLLRQRFVTSRPRTQLNWAGTTWVIHLAAFAILLVTAPL